MDDTISRRMAIEAIQNRHMMLSKEKVLLINDIEKLPSSQPKWGKWKKITQDDDDYAKCSECGYVLTILCVLDCQRCQTYLSPPFYTDIISV